MKILSLMAAVQALGLTLVTVDAEAARRLGGGSSNGMQKKMSPTTKESASTPAKAPTAAAPQAQPKSTWVGPIAGLAAGLGLAALASHLGFGEGLASMMMIGLLVMAAIAMIGVIMRRRATHQQPAVAGAGRMPNAQADTTLGSMSWPTRENAAQRPVNVGIATDLMPSDPAPVAALNGVK